MYLGEEVKKLKYSNLFKLKYLFMSFFALSFGLFLIVISIATAEHNKDSKSVLFAGIFIMLSGIIHFLLYRRAINKIGTYTIYKLGIKNDKKDKAILFSDFDTYYVTEHTDYGLGKERIEYLTIKSKDGEVFTVSSQIKNGIKSVLNAYLLNVTKDKVEELKNGKTERFDIVSKFANIKRKFKLTNKQVEESIINPEVIGEVLLSINGIKIIEKNAETFYSMDDINRVENKGLSRVRITTKNGNRIIVVTRAELFAELINRIKKS